MVLKRLYLHAGFQKTGSTALQAFLFRNRDALLENGILYPAAGLGTYSAHHSFAAGFNLPGTNWIEGGEAANITAEKILEEAATSNCSKIVVSSEEFMFLENIEKFQALFPDWELNVIVFIRPQIEWILSRLRHEILSPSVRRVNWDVDKKMIDSCNYYNYYVNIRRFIPESNIHFRLYRKTVEKKLSNVNDLGVIIGFSLEDLDLSPVLSFQHQKSLPYPAVELLRMSNIVKLNRRSFVDIKKFLLNEFGGFGSVGLEKLKNVRESILELNDYYAAYNRELAVLINSEFDELFPTVEGGASSDPKLSRIDEIDIEKRIDRLLNLMLLKRLDAIDLESNTRLKNE